MNQMSIASSGWINFSFKFKPYYLKIEFSAVFPLSKQVASLKQSHFRYWTQKKNKYLKLATKWI